MDQKYVVNLKGKPYPTWPGILDAATDAGLKSLTTSIVQIPSPENGNMAVVRARAEFADGRVFEDVGDASPANCSAPIASAALRMASTRAKGRVLRDALNIGETMAEELGDDPPSRGEGGAGYGVLSAAEPKNPEPRTQQSAPRPNPGSNELCRHAGCGVTLNKNHQLIYAAKEHAGLVSGGPFCPTHLDERLRSR